MSLARDPQLTDMDYQGQYGRRNIKRTGKVLHEMKRPANVTGLPMTYMLDGAQYPIMAIGARRVPAKLIAMTIE